MLWNVSATESGGGVAEMLRPFLGYFLAAGVAARWLVLDGDEEFFATTKSLHIAVHGVGDPRGLGPRQHHRYQQVLSTNNLVDDPADPAAFAGALRRLVTDADLARQLGEVLDACHSGLSRKWVSKRSWAARPDSRVHPGAMQRRQLQVRARQVRVPKRCRASTTACMAGVVSIALARRAGQAPSTAREHEERPAVTSGASSCFISTGSRAFYCY